MQTGTVDLVILIFIFLGLQAWWLIPIIKNNNKLNKNGKNITEEIRKLERIYKKNM